MLTHDFYFQNFFPKNLAKKLGRVLQWRISGTARVRVRSCSTPPPFRADEKYPGGGLFSAGIPAAFPRGAPTLLGAELVGRKFRPYLQPHPSSRRIAWRRLAPSAADQRFFNEGRPGLRRQGKGYYPIVCQSWWRRRCRSAQRPPVFRLQLAA